MQKSYPHKSRVGRRGVDARSRRGRERRQSNQCRGETRAAATS